MSRRPRRQHTPEQKAALVKRHLIDKAPISEVCNENDLQPSVFYDWLRQFQANCHTVFVAPARASTREQRLEAEVLALKATIAKKDEVIAWVAQEHAELKKKVCQS